jgi:hypothetical protein
VRVLLKPRRPPGRGPGAPRMRPAACSHATQTLSLSPAPSRNPPRLYACAQPHAPSDPHWHATPPCEPLNFNYATLLAWRTPCRRSRHRQRRAALPPGAAACPPLRQHFLRRGHGPRRKLRGFALVGTGGSPALAPSPTARWQADPPSRQHITSTLAPAAASPPPPRQPAALARQSAPSKPAQGQRQQRLKRRARLPRASPFPIHLPRRPGFAASPRQGPGGRARARPNVAPPTRHGRGGPRRDACYASLLARERADAHRPAGGAPPQRTARPAPSSRNAAPHARRPLAPAGALPATLLYPPRPTCRGPGRRCPARARPQTSQHCRLLPLDPAVPMPSRTMPCGEQPSPE